MVAVFTRFLGLMFLVCSIRESSASEDITMYMDEMCYVPIKFGLIASTELIVKISRFNTYPANSTCFVKVVAKTGYRLMFKFLSVETDTCNDFMGVYGETITAPDAINAFVCVQPRNVYTTQGSTGNLLFLSDGDGNDGGMSILVTMFKTKNGDCGKKHFNCDNNRCIHDALKCNSRDNCGNNQDEEEGCRWWLGLVIGLTVTAVISTTALIIFIIFLKKYSGRKRIQTQPVRGWVLNQPHQGWAMTQTSQSSGGQPHVQNVTHPYPTKNGNLTQYSDIEQVPTVQSQQSSLETPSFSEPPTYMETAPAPVNYTLPADTVMAPAPAPVMASSVTGGTGAHGPQQI
ncbi:uncharacterized protein [Haliotis cracherodii]|uniref:uncharacterized protein n=1 Tax=Haliotis cracherodii TaxID=6455 RepID=UPI0039EC5590